MPRLPRGLGVKEEIAFFHMELGYWYSPQHCHCPGMK